MPAAAPEPEWRAIVTPEDRARIDGLGERWRALLAGLSRNERRLADREGALLDPDVARAVPSLSPGSYRCHLVKLGAAGRTEPAVRTFPDFVCYVRAESDNRLSFTKQTGTELPGGWFHADGDKRLVLIGANQREPGDNSLAYGTDSARDLVGVLERIGPFRWRLALPWRGDTPGLDIYELVPAPVEQQVAEPDVPGP